MIPPLEIRFDVAAPQVHAFETWTSRIDSWWPRTHSVSEDDALTVVLEPQLGGRLYERTSSGDEFDWGEVTVWEPPDRFGYLWHLRRDRADATDVLITFVPLDERSTRVDIRHTGWERLGDGGQDWREQNQGGWSGVLPSYIATAETKGTS